MFRYNKIIVVFVTIAACCVDIQAFGRGFVAAGGQLPTDTARLSDTIAASKNNADKLSEVIVEAKAQLSHNNIIMPVTVETIGKNFFIRKNSGNFAKTLTAIPGMSSMDIGTGFSKPVIRGLGFNRVAVVDKGIVQQSQQWGADHGLEIDQYDVDNVSIHKGPMSLLYGSDAIGGVVEILPSSPPKDNGFWGDVSLIGKSNNDLLGTSVSANIKQNKWLLKARFTTQYYGDYRIPADTIVYLTWQMPVEKRRMKNTAGREHNASFSATYNSDKLAWTLYLSDVYAKNGFFPGSHGIPDLSRLRDDGSYRNIEMPYSSVNHFKAISNAALSFDKGKLMLDVGFQQNDRRELSKFHTHYSDQPLPEKNPDLELSFLLNTLTINTHLLMNEDSKWTYSVGISSEIQQNSVGGYSFLLPEFKRYAAGAYWVNKLNVCSHLSLLAGIRYDVARLTTKGFYDDIFAQYLAKQGYNADFVAKYAQRATDIAKTFSDISGSVGLVYRRAYQTWRVNIGKSFRYPLANELASNGIHHGAFRHEQGNSNLLPEQSYQLDAGYEYSTSKWNISATPFVSYFSNYIFLDPTGEWSILPHSGQIYRYRQAKVWLGGGELSARYSFNAYWSASASIDYIYNLNITDGYPLPFSVPAKTALDIGYSSPASGICRNYSVSVRADYIFAQNRIARNEEPTPATLLFNLSANAFFSVGKFVFITDLQIQNIMNTAYLNHLSFYRKLNAPEPGRNIQLIVRIPFNSK